MTARGQETGKEQLEHLNAIPAPTFTRCKSHSKPTTEPASSTDTADRNIILASYQVTITKLDSGNPISQVADTTYTMPTENVPTGEVNAEGQAVTESAPISIYNEDGTTKTVAVDTIRDDNSLTTFIINERLGFLPATGGSGIFFYLGVGGAIALVALFFLSKNKREIDELTA